MGPPLHLAIITARNHRVAGGEQGPACHMLTCPCWLAYFSILKMEAACSSEMSIDFQPTARRYIPENRTLHNHHCNSLMSQKVACCLPCNKPN
jgi:hypothetical protein